MSKNQAEHHAPDEPKVRALTLAQEGHSGRYIAIQVGYPHATVAGWLRKANEATQGNKEVLSKWTDLTLQAQDLMGDGVDAIQRDGDAKKHLQTLLYIAGTGTDKLQKDTQPIQAQTVIVNFIEARKPVIEGEVVSRD